MNEPTCRHCGQTKDEHTHVALRCFMGSEEYFEPSELAQSQTPRTDAEKIQLAIDALKLAYGHGHYCDNYAEGKKCPGCEAGYALEKITGRKWTQEECELWEDG